MSSPPFHFKKFSLHQEGVAHPVGTDGVLLGAWAEVTGANTILDVGTGTGVIALMMAQRGAAAAMVTAIDLHPGSVACAAENFKASPWASRLQVHAGAFQDFAAKSTTSFDLIVSNPPFFSELTLSPNAERSLGRYNGTLNGPELLAGVGRLLGNAGRFCVILPTKEGRQLCELGVLCGLYCTRELQVRTRAEKPVERLLLQMERDPGHFRRESLTIYGENGHYTKAYLELVSDFYL